jgi:hypothetical protein
MGVMQDNAWRRVGPGAAVIGMVWVFPLVGPAGAGVAAGGVGEVPPAGGELAAWRLPFGIEAGYYWQQQPYQAASLAVQPLVPIVLPGFQVTGIDSEVEEVHLKFDWDALPFLNLFALGGAVEGNTEVRTNAMLLPQLPIDYDGWVYGLGATAMYGTERWFASLTAVYSWTELDVSRFNMADSNKDALVIMPRVGMIFGDLSVWVGAMYQSIEEDYRGSGTISILGNPVPVGFAAELEQAEDWNVLVGLNYGLSESWNVTLEGGLGDRESVMVGVQWRF